MIASASQSTVRGLFAVGRWNPARLLLDTAKVEAAITTTTPSVTTAVATTASVSLQVSVAQQTGTSADQFRRLGSVNSIVEASVLKAVKGVATATAARGTKHELGMASGSHGMDDTVACVLDANTLG